LVILARNQSENTALIMSMQSDGSWPDKFKKLTAEISRIAKRFVQAAV
jgi:hypothetical protein